MTLLQTLLLAYSFAACLFGWWIVQMFRENHDIFLENIEKGAEGPVDGDRLWLAYAGTAGLMILATLLWPLALFGLWVLGTPQKR